MSHTSFISSTPAGASKPPGTSLARTVAVLVAVVLLATSPTWGQPTLRGHAHNEPRNFDARTKMNSGVEHAPSAAQLAAVERARAERPALLVRFDRTTGATRSLSNPVGSLTREALGGDAMGSALAYLERNLDLLGLNAEDLDGFEVSDSVRSSVSGATHLYLRQTYADIPVYNGLMQVNVLPDGRILSVNNGFLPGLRGAVNTLRAARGAERAVARAAAELGINLRGNPKVLEELSDARRTTVIDPTGISLEPIEASLAWLPISRGSARLVWNFQIYTLDANHWYDLTVDAVSGKIWTRFDWVADASYRVYPQPVESPNHTTPLPPDDGRVLVTDPDDPTFSPLGWHDDGSSTFTIMQGNNVHAYDDQSPNNRPPRNEPDCGTTLSCDFPIDLTQEPDAYVEAAVANLFYWNNIIHDIQAGFGFDEAAGNFQETNFTPDGVGGDSVNAEAQDGSGNCNANFATPTDGGNPRMQMFTCDMASPSRDGDLDNMVIVHEYGHGISIRQVGGPSTSSCLNNTQQPGEGWSDWLGLAYTAEVGDAGTDKRGVGTYLFGEGPDGDGIRVLPYSTDESINNWTYESIDGMSVPHGVGSVWAQGIWEVYWALVDQHGFDPDLYNPMGPAGNQRAMLYVNEGFKNTACSPTFLDARDGIIAAATSLHGGEDVCLLWNAFAAYGLGTDATTDGPDSTTATNGFSVPPECGTTCDNPPPAPTGVTASPNGDNQILVSWDAVSGAASYNVFRSTTSGGPYDLIANVAATSTSHNDTGLNGGTTYFYVVQTVASDGCTSDFSAEASATATGSGCTTTVLYSNDFETGSGLDDWTVGKFVNNSKVDDWRGIQSCTAASGSNIFRFGGVGCTDDYGDRNFNFSQPMGATGISVPAGATDVQVSFGHRYEFEGGFDGGSLTVSVDGANYFLVPGADFVSGPAYNGTVAPNCPPRGSAGIPIFTGSQSTFATSVAALDATCDAATGGSGGCADQTLFIGFTAVTDCGTTRDGWFLDDVTVTACIP